MADDQTPPGPSPYEKRSQNTLQYRCLTSAGNGTNVAVTAGATTYAITFPRTEQGGGWGMVCSTNWNTTSWVTAKTASGCTINFGTAAPANASFDFTTFRAES